MTGIQPRSVIGTPQPPASRRRLMRVGVLLAHEVGVATKEGTGRYQSADPARVLDDARAAATFGINAKPTAKPWEYNYMLGRDGSIFEQAGEFMGSHCLNFNPDSLGVIWLNALGLPPTQAQIDAWWWLRSHLVDTGQLTELHTVAPHYRYRSTSCCGVLAETPGAAWKSPTGEGRLGNLIEALTVEPVPPPLPIPDPEDDMNMILYRDRRFNNVFRVGDSAITIGEKVFLHDRPQTGSKLDLIEDVHDQSLIAYMRSSHLTMEQMVPSNETAPDGSQYPAFPVPADLA